MEKNKPLLNKIFSNKWNPFLIVLTIGLLLYGRTLLFDFTYLDDNNLILSNQYFLSDIGNIFRSFMIDVFHLFNSSAFYYRPMLTISLLFDYQIGGAYPFFYHLTNVILHIVAAYLVYIFLSKLRYRKPASLLFSLIFLVHPVMTQAVAWIPGRNDSLLAVFVLSSLIFFLRFLNTRSKPDLFGTLIFFSLALFTKESAVLTAIMMLFYLLFIQKNRPRPADTAYLFSGAAILVAFWAWLRHLVLQSSPTLSLYEMARSLTLNSPAVIQFLGKIFLPFNLSVLPVMADTTFVYGAIAAVALAALIFIARNKRWNMILFGFLWFFAFLLPSFIRPNSSVMSDFIEHRIYLPIIGIFIVLLETSVISLIDLKKRRNLAAWILVLIALSSGTFYYSGNFKDRMAFWNNAVKNSPDYPLAHRNLGAMEYLAGDFESARKEFLKSLELNPEEQMAHNNLGLIYMNEGRYDEALAEYEKEIEVNPYYDDVYYNLGLLYWKEGKRDQAVSNWKKTLQLNPEHQGAAQNLYLAANYSLKYMSLLDWPPITRILPESFHCETAGNEISSGGRTELREVSGRRYCVTTEMGAAAGSVYYQYAYVFPAGNKEGVMTFGIRAPQCANYPDPQRSECETERKSFDVDRFVDSFLYSEIK